jgi:hypothetical protein
VQRLRLTFTKEEPIRYIGHLDVVRLWERACRRAALPLAYTLGFTPHPRLQFAAPLALGVTGDAEVLDAFLTARLAPEEFVARIGAALPPGSRALSAREVPLLDPAVAARLRWAEYRVRAGGPVPDDPPPPAGAGPAAPPGGAAGPAPASRWSAATRAGPHQPGVPPELPDAPDAPETPWRAAADRLPPPPAPSPAPPRGDVAARIGALLASASLPRERRREQKTMRYDLRPLVLDLWLDAAGAPPGEVALGMRLRADPRGQGRPDEVAAALGLTALRVHRVGIGLADGEP